MSDAARKLIDAVKHSLLGVLVVRLWPALLVISLVDEQRRPRAPELAEGLNCVALIVIILAWSIGFASTHRRPRGGGFALERIQEAPPNGFGVWSERPDGGYMPPQITRSFVMAFAWGPPKGTAWEAWLTATLTLSMMIILVFALYANGILLARINPSLAEPLARNGLILAVEVLLVAMCVRRWAVDCRNLLIADK